MNSLHNRSLLFLFALLLPCLPIAAQQTITFQSETTGETETMLLPENMVLPYDSLISDWHAKTLLAVPNDCHYNSNAIPVYPDSVYIDRLQRLPTIMDMPYCEAVRDLIDIYCGRLRNSVSLMLGAANFYFPLFEEALDAYDLPHELKYLPIIESSLKPTAKSRAGAAGLWQFILKTGKLYGLEINSLVDERCDPVKSTYAAARYLRDLYDIFRDWNLVIAAYNCGPGNINKAIHRAGGATDYWTIYPYLPRETQGYVPSFIAANYVMNYYCKHNICPMDATLPLDTDTIHVHRELSLSRVADVCQIPLEEVRALNPQYKKDIVPGKAHPCTLRLPEAKILAFIDAGDSIYAHRGRPTTVDVKGTQRGSTSTAGATYHTIKKGDTLGSIAARYHVTVKQLQQLNNLRGTNITAGKKLRIR